jgi:hypothetical protein
VTSRHPQHCPTLPHRVLQHGNPRRHPEHHLHRHRHRRHRPDQHQGGIATVQIDSKPAGTIDTYAPGGKSYQQVLFADTSLPPGTHTPTVTVTGQKDPAATADTVSVDGIDLNAADQPAFGALRVNDITAPRAGEYTLKITYINPDATDRYGYLSVDGAPPISRRRRSHDQPCR